MGRAPEVTLTFTTTAAACEAEQVFAPFSRRRAALPVIGLLEDGEPFTADRLESLGGEAEELFEDAIDELDDRDSGWQTQAVPVKGGAVLTLAARIGDERDARELLVPGVLAAAAELLGATELAVAIPARDALLVTDAAQKWQLVAAFATAARLQHAAAGDDALYPGLPGVSSTARSSASSISRPRASTTPRAASSVD